MWLFDMRGSWDGFHARLFDLVVAREIAALYERLAEQLAPRLPPAGRILDVGCGAGRPTAQLARRRPGARVTGIDLSATQIALARREHAAVPNLEFRTGDALALPFPDGSFDAAVSLSSIKHWPDPARGVRELARVVRPGGIVFVLEADRECTRETAERFVRRWRFVPPPAVPVLAWYFLRFPARQGCTAAELRRLLEAAGVRGVEAVRDERDPAAYAWGRAPETPPVAGAEVM
ncbi:MAG: class I SAM-dependent methyltransferase [Deltaproteobacteria bacterium]|nr:class I SAM-dependent methyltransferase [Deltaproteobacteria bacterium]